MSQQHPIDDLFRRHLEEHSTAPPMHLWDTIDQKRSWKHKLWLRFKRNQLQIGALALGLVASLLLWAQWTTPPTIESFPIPIPASIETKPISALEDAHSNHTLAVVDKTSSTNDFTSAPLSQQQASVSPSSEPATITKSVDPILTNQAISPSMTSDLQTKGIEEAPLAAPSLESATLTADADETTKLDFKLEQLADLAPIENAFAPATPALGLEYLAKTECTDFMDHSIKLSLDLMVGPSFALRELGPRDEELTVYANLRQDSETPVFAYSAAARLSATTAWGLALRSGLSYTQINERFEYLNEQEERIVITNIKDAAGNIIGTDTIVEQGTRQLEVTNHYRMLDIPVLLGYELSHGKFGFSINGGILLNILFDQEGQILSPANDGPVSFGNGIDQIQPFRKRLALGYYGSLGITYELKQGLSLLVEPQFRIDPQSFTRRDFAVSQRYFTTGLSIGLRKDL